MDPCALINRYHATMGPSDHVCPRRPSSSTGMFESLVTMASLVVSKISSSPVVNYINNRKISRMNHSITTLFFEQDLNKGRANGVITIL